jgi:hypothetical protein
MAESGLQINHILTLLLTLSVLATFEVPFAEGEEGFFPYIPENYGTFQIYDYDTCELLGSIVVHR